MSARPDEPDDAALVAGALAGQGDAFARLVRRHKEGIYRLIRAHIGDAEEALDLTQDTFLAAHGALARFDTGRPLRPWLARIALNQCRDWARRRRVRAFFRLAAPLDVGAITVADDAPDPWRAVAGRMELRALAQALAALPAALKEPLLLQVMEQLPQAEVGRLLGISEKAVETRVRRARQTLMTKLAGEAAGERADGKNRGG